MFLKIGCFSEDCQEDLLCDGVIVFSFSFELHHLQYIEFPAKQHESVVCQGLKRKRHIIKSGRSFDLILDGEKAIMFEDYSELILVHVHHFQ